MLTPSSWNCTPATPTLSEAFAVTPMVPETVAPAVGELIDTVGAVVSGGPGANARIVPAEAAVVPFHDPTNSLPSATIGAANVAPSEPLDQSCIPVIASN